MITRERLGILAMAFIAATLGGGVTGYLISAATVEAAAAPRVISARKFVLLDQAGKTRAVLEDDAAMIPRSAVVAQHQAVAGLASDAERHGIKRDPAPLTRWRENQEHRRRTLGHYPFCPARAFSADSCASCDWQSGQ